VAPAIMSAIPATLAANCMAMLPENSTRTTSPLNDSKTPEQYIASEFRHNESSRLFWLHQNEKMQQTARQAFQNQSPQPGLLQRLIFFGESP
jgi:hypothetical protein